MAGRCTRPAAGSCLSNEHRTLARRAVVAGLALLLADCAGPAGSGRNASELRYGVRSSPRVVAEGDPIPKGGGREQIGQPYVVGGRTYVPRPGHGYDREGEASWYGTAFHGRLTANGEVFDRESIAAAHPTLPLPSYVRVTNSANGRSMIVRVNDRGPYEHGRLIDLSERAADALGFRRHGTTHVRVQYAGKASLAGSDDAKLLATLRGADDPVSIASRPAPVNVARADIDDESRAETGLRAKAVSPPPSRTPRNGLPEYAEPVRTPLLQAPLPPPPRRSVVTAAQGEPLDIRPPSRPDLAGIY